MTQIGIIGATGTLGKEVVKLLDKENVSFVGLSRNPKKAEFPCRFFDYERQDSYEGALKGLKQVLLIAAKGGPSLVEFLKAGRNLDHIIVISGISANVRNDSFLATVEECVDQSQIPHTTLRLNWFMQNFLTFFYEEIMREDCIALPAGSSKTSFIDVRDVAKMVLTLFENSTHRDQTFSVTGPQALTHEEVAHTLSDAIGRTITYKDISESQARSKFLKLGWSPETTEETIRLFQEMREGKVSEVSHAVELVTGYPATPLSEFVKRYSDCWKL